MISVTEPAPLRPRWRSDRRRRAAAHPVGTEAQRRTAGRNFLVSRGMTAQPSGEENYGPLLRHGRSRRSRPSARSAILRGGMRARPDRAHITETMATRAPRKCRPGRGRHRHALLPTLHTPRSGTAFRTDTPCLPGFHRPMLTGSAGRPRSRERAPSANMLQSGPHRSLLPYPPDSEAARCESPRSCPASPVARAVSDPRDIAAGRSGWGHGCKADESGDAHRDRADDGEKELPRRRRHQHLGDPMCRAVAHDNGGHRIEQDDQQLEPHPRHQGEGDLANNEGCSARDETDDDPADNTSTRTIRPEPGHQTHGAGQGEDCHGKEQPAQEANAGDEQEGSKDEHGGGLRATDNVGRSRLPPPPRRNPHYSADDTVTGTKIRAAYVPPVTISSKSIAGMRTLRSIRSSVIAFPRDPVALRRTLRSIAPGAT
ncbi:hypothetical protein ASAP_1774 [Asaia bogorensis]|uniref:Uncharacterized protein n=1 Tax=Asaia bogorensis TaxID=91915 RepID=A0A060QFC5_9PROT|nr:hypothetical protein ASAP_1774 [Asaia bogorensis]